LSQVETGSTPAESSACLRSPWRLAAVVTGGQLLVLGGPDPVAGVLDSGNTSVLLAGG
jgi:hypothetical protein